jgi:hypothetical protein
MSDNHGTARNRDALLDNFAAELTVAAYRVALRHGTGGTWVDLELDLWKALADTVKTWEREWPPSSEAAFVCDWAGGQSEALPGDVRDGLGYWRDAREPLSGE